MNENTKKVNEFLDKLCSLHNRLEESIEFYDKIFNLDKKGLVLMEEFIDKIKQILKTCLSDKNYSREEIFLFADFFRKKTNLFNYGKFIRFLKMNYERKRLIYDKKALTKDKTIVGISDYELSVQREKNLKKFLEKCQQDFLTKKKFGEIKSLASFFYIFIKKNYQEENSAKYLKKIYSNFVKFSKPVYILKIFSIFLENIINEDFILKEIQKMFLDAGIIRKALTFLKKDKDFSEQNQALIFLKNCLHYGNRIVKKIGFIFKLKLTLLRFKHRS